MDPDGGQSQRVLVTPHNNTVRAGWWMAGIGGALLAATVLAVVVSVSLHCTGDETCWVPQVLTRTIVVLLTFSVSLSG
jgi:hypothetical protein